MKAASLPRLKRRRRPHPPPPPRKTIGTNSDANASIVQCGTFGGERSEKEEGEEEEPVLWDLTAGLGTDAFMLASAGWTVKMFERSPVVAALLQVRVSDICFSVTSTGATDSRCCRIILGVAPTLLCFLCTRTVNFEHSIEYALYRTTPWKLSTIIILTRHSTCWDVSLRQT